MQLSVFIYVCKISFSSSSAIHERETVYCKRFFLFESAVGVGASPPGKYTELLTVHIDCDVGENYCPSHPLSMHYFQATDDTYTHTTRSSLHHLSLPSPLHKVVTAYPSHSSSHAQKTSFRFHHDTTRQDKISQSQRQVDTRLLLLLLKTTQPNPAVPASFSSQRDNTQHFSLYVVVVVWQSNNKAVS